MTYTSRSAIKANVLTFSGWRREVFGADALKLTRGEVAHSAEGRRIKTFNPKPKK